MFYVAPLARFKHCYMAVPEIQMESGTKVPFERENIGNLDPCGWVASTQHRAKRQSHGFAKVLFKHVLWGALRESCAILMGVLRSCPKRGSRRGSF